MTNDRFDDLILYIHAFIGFGIIGLIIYRIFFGWEWHI